VKTYYLYFDRRNEAFFDFIEVLERNAEVVKYRLILSSYPGVYFHEPHQSQVGSAIDTESILVDTGRTAAFKVLFGAIFTSKKLKSEWTHD
jgi:hypothetical protein